MKGEAYKAKQLALRDSSLAMCNRRLVALNCFSLAFFLAILPALCVAYRLTRLPVFASLVCTLCLHNRAPYWPRAARGFARIVSSGWAAQRVQAEGVTQNEGRSRCFVVEPPRGFGLSPAAEFNEKLLVWAFVLLSADEWTKPLRVVTELPAICNAPGVRLLFQLAGFVDCRAVSVAQLIDLHHDLLFFDKSMADMQAAKRTPRLDVKGVTVKAKFGDQ